MKKILTSVFCLTSLVGADAFCAESTELFDGLYLGGGLGWNFIKYNSYRLGVGGTLCPEFSIGAVVAYDEQKVNRPTFSVVLGYGKTLYKNVYVGLEGLMEISNNKTESVLINNKEIKEVAHDSDGGYVKYKGFSAQIGCRLGYVFDKLKTLVYVKPAVSFFNEMELWNDARRTMSGPDTKLEGHPDKTTFALAFGAETKVFDNFAVRLEAERLFKRSFTGSSFEAHSGADTGWRTKANTDSYNVRLLLSYTFR